ncbi:MAG: SpoVA/SpoVAEb family sporulation membrane protein [Clostridia bacterium]|nr:SpoVA/SpoVAEb family sporulation membrane protein [Clostridia bacterium]MDY4083695.1 SpoVA/SpoVAEb family sporulation membrane protein [Eubacteriales bacterium]
MIDSKQYQEYVHKNAQKSNELLTLTIAFVVGGIICMIGQGFSDLYTYLFPKWETKDVATLTSITMIFLGSFFTGLGWYDKLGAYAGAGTIIPITGFANSVVSPAIEFRKEGIIFGTMAKMFLVAGPIIVSGVGVSVAVGIIYYIIGLF